MNDLSPLVSIISPTYNHEKYIADCIHSVQEQTYANWEMIIIDDGSSDSTYSIARKFADTDSRIQVYTQQNKGIFKLGENYNFALSKAKGKYIAVLECDDVWFKDKLTLQVEGLENDPESVLSWGHVYGAKPDLSGYYDSFMTYDDKLLNVYRNSPAGAITKELIFKGFIPALTVVLRKEVLEKTGGFIQKYDLPLVDLPTWVACSAYGTFNYIPQPLGCWREYPLQVSKTHIVNMCTGSYLLAKEVCHEGKLIGKEQMRSIDRHFKRQLVIEYSRTGRYKLIKKDFAGARKDYLKSLFQAGLRAPVWKIRSLIGICCSFFHTDVESIAKLLGKKAYR